MSPLVLLLLLAGARADEGAVQTGDRTAWRLWSWSGAEALPAWGGEQQLRAEQRVGLALRPPSGFTADMLGSLRDPADGDAGWSADLYRLSFGLLGGRYSANVGRFVLASERGFLRLDGARVDVGIAPSVTLRAWGGRAWEPETFVAGDQGLLGAEVRVDPGQALSGGLGWEGRVVEESFVQRLHAFGRARDTRGSLATVLGEVAPRESSESPLGVAARFDLQGRTPIGSRVEVGAGARWEDLDRAVQPEALTSPMDWLAGPGYVAADVAARARGDVLIVDARVGPTLALGEGGPTGGIGRLGVTALLGDHVSAGVAATGAMADPSWVWGGVAETRWHPGEVASLGLQGGWFRFVPLAGPVANVVEGRLDGAAPLVRGERGELSLAGQVAAGSDRLLDPWVRAGVALQGTYGKGNEP
ncbi:MAG: hypothetical protein ABIO70_04980 [Pseudomonadota bacterium]